MFFWDTLRLADVTFHVHSGSGTTAGRYLFGFGAGLGGALVPNETSDVPGVLWYYMKGGEK